MGDAAARWRPNQCLIREALAATGPIRGCLQWIGHPNCGPTPDLRVASGHSATRAVSNQEPHNRRVLRLSVQESTC